MISRGLQAPASLVRHRPCQYQCQRHLERQWLPQPPSRRTITTKPLPGDHQTLHNRPTSPSSNPRRTKWRRLSNTPPIPPDDEFEQWRDSIFYVTPRQSIDATETTPRPDSSNQPAVLEISGLPPSLLDTDFQRLASPGQHVDGWTGGLVKVLPSLHPHTKDHQGQYFLFFDTLLAARSYADALQSLRKATPPNPAPTHLTLLPPSLPRPKINLLPLAHIKALLRHFYPPPDPGGPICLPPNLTPRPEHLHASVFHPERDDARAARVRVRLAGSRITPATLRAAIARDGRERGLPWGVLVASDGSGGVSPLPQSGAWVERGLFSGGTEVEGGGGKVRAFDGFVVTFEEAAEARRFVRGWHGREMLDRRNDRVMGVEVVGLW